MINDYNPKEIEGKWQKFWLENEVYKTEENSPKPKQYILDMFPYPSGAGLHVGHPRGYIGSDILARMRRMQGYNVLHPMGFDAFGLPAEQYAIQTGEHPATITEKSIETYKRQLEIIGLSYDWSREVRTMDPGFYKWTQWIFLQLFDSYYDEKENKAKLVSELIKKFEKEDLSWRGKSEKEKQDVLMNYRLAYEGYSEVNWCPELGTVLANDEVLDGPDGTLVSERGGYPVEKKNMRQWFLRITSYADRLLSGLDTIDWPSHIKEIQRNWIGKSEGAEISFIIKKTELSDEIPVMIDHKNPPQEGYPTVRRRNIHGVVYSKERDAYLTFVWKKLPWTTIIVGGVDEGENLVEAARREIAEETGYTDLQFEGILGKPIESHYFAAHKGENREAVTTGVYFTLRSEAQIPVAEEERIHNDVVWTSSSEFLPEKLAHVEIASWLERIAELQASSSVKVFTTRPDTLFGATYVTLAPEHPLLQTLKGDTKNWNEISAYIELAKNKSEADRKDAKDKTGIEIKGIKAVNPANGEEVPVWVSDYVLANYGTGAVMAVPAHDERDFEFAKKFGLPIKEVIAQVVGNRNEETLERHRVCVVIEKNGKVLCERVDEDNTKFLGDYILVGGGIEDGETPEVALVREINEETGVKNVHVLEKIGVFRSSWFSKRRQVFRTMLHHAFLVDFDETKIQPNPKEANLVWVEVDELIKQFYSAGDIDQAHILERYKNKEFNFFDGDGELINSTGFNGLNSEEAKQKITAFVGGKMVTKYKMRDAIFARQRYWGEPIPLVHKDGIISALSEKDLPLELPKVDSYKPTGTGESPLAGVSEWIEKGSETNTMPGWAGSSWYFLRYMDPKNSNAFASSEAIDYWQNVDVYVGGSEHSTGHLLYSRFWHKFLHDRGFVSTEEPFKVLKNQGFIIASDGRKMSKRWGNVVNPDEMVERFGADAFRLYEAFIGPFDQYTSWNTDGVVGTRRFLERVWRCYKNNVVSYEINYSTSVNGSDISNYENLQRFLNKTIKKITEDIENFRFNTSVSSMMILLNEIEAERRVTTEDFKKFLQILAPFAPHMTEELWRGLGEKDSIHISKWPEFDESKIKDEKVKIAIQVNGKVRDEVEIAPDATEEEANSLALGRDIIKNLIGEQKIKKFIYVPGKIINIVL